MAELYEQFAGVVRLAHLLTGSVAAAEDVVSDAFMRVAPRYALVDNPRAYGAPRPSMVVAPISARSSASRPLRIAPPCANRSTTLSWSSFSTV